MIWINSGVGGLCHVPWAEPPELPSEAGTARPTAPPRSEMRSTPRMFAAALALAASATTRADVVEASATTVVTAGQQVRGALANQTPELDTVVPVYELISVTARDVKNPLFQNLEFVVSGWASYDLADVRWNAGTTEQFTGDLTTGYVRGQLFSRALTLRVGRAYVVAGTGRMLQLDGGDLLLRLPGNVSLSAFGGLPVAQRFRTRAGIQSWNPAGGELAYGGRLGWTLPLAGAYGRGLDLGLSAVVVTDAKGTVANRAYDPATPLPGVPASYSDDSAPPVRRDVGLDARYQPKAGLLFTANGTWSLAAERLAEAGLVALWTATPKLFVTFDAKQLSPDLFLSQNSILSVFTDKERTDLGGGVRYQLSQSTSVGGDYHALLEPTGEAGKTELGHEAAARLDWEHGPARAGGEVTYLTTGGLGAEQNGYVGGRVYGRRELGRAFFAGDVVVHSFKQEINGYSLAVTGSISTGYDLGGGWATVLAGHAGVTPFLEQQADLLVKLVYNTTYRTREVK
jgi:hypothetical protein